MFDTLEADIVIMQEAKIQRKDLTDDMVLVPGWDVFFSLPKDKKGRIFTLNPACISLNIFRRVLRGSNLHQKFQMLPHSCRGGPHRFALSTKDFD